MPTNAWSMMVMSVDSANQTASIYLNGRLAWKTATCSIASYNANVLGIGSYLGTAAAAPFHGNIDDARVYTTTLSLSQIEKLYAEGLPKHSLAMKSE